MAGRLHAPFPWFGGKSRWASQIWERLGDDVVVYVEPFAGSLAVLLHRSTPAQREIVCDTDGFIVNFWRALREDPEAVAYWSDYPTFHHDLSARRLWLANWGIEHGPLLSEDAEWYDVKAAGWWCWGISNWIGGGFMATKLTSDKRPSSPTKTGGRGVQVAREDLVQELAYNSRPHLKSKGGGQGVQVTRENMPGGDKRPRAPYTGRGTGVQVVRKDIPSVELVKGDQRPVTTGDKHGRGVQVNRKLVDEGKRPYTDDSMYGRGVSVHRKMHGGERRPQVQPHPGGHGVSVLTNDGQVPNIASWPGGSGVAAERRTLTGEIGNGERLLPWFYSLAQRLARVVVLNRSWESALSPTLLMHTPTGPKPPVGIFLDPPYRFDQRKDEIYSSDWQEDPEVPAVKAYEWAVEHGEKYRIAYACLKGDFEIPPGWEAETLSLGGPNANRDKLDQVMFSPACVNNQGRLF